MLTRTIKVSCSAFAKASADAVVMLFARPAGAGRTGMTLSHLPGQVHNPVPGFPQLHAIKFCTLTYFWLRDKLHPMTFASLSQGLRRDTAPVLFRNFIYRDYFPSIYKTCTPDDASHVRTFGAAPPSLRYGGQSTPARNKLCTMPTFAKASAGKDGKNTPPAAGQACHTCLATGRNSRLKYQDCHGGRRVTCHPYSLAPHYPDILCRDLTLGPLYCRAVMRHA